MTTSAFTVLSYHRVAEPDETPDLAASLIDAYPADFEAQMRHLATHYTVVSSWDLVRALEEGFTLPRHAVALTFDDGYRCFRETAMPVLRRLGLPVTLFVATHMVGSAGRLFWWDDLNRALRGTHLTQIEVAGVGLLRLNTREARAAAFSRVVALFERMQEEAANNLLRTIVAQCGVTPNRQRYLLDWEELRALAAEGVAIGPHTRHHPILARATPARVRAETLGSWRDLARRLERPLPLFCYPNGQAHAVNDATIEVVRQVGLRGAFTTMPGVNIVGKTDPFRMHRIGISAGDSLRHFAIKITPAGRAYRQLKSLVRRVDVNAGR